MPIMASMEIRSAQVRGLPNKAEGPHVCGPSLVELPGIELAIKIALTSNYGDLSREMACTYRK
jgi:hypothetical protein